MAIRRLTPVEIAQQEQERLPGKLRDELADRSRKVKFALIILTVNLFITVTSVLLINVWWHTVMVVVLVLMSVGLYVYENVKVYQVETQLSAVENAARVRSQKGQ